MAQWPHAPLHWTCQPGTFIVTGATLHKQPLFDRPAKLDLVLTTLFDVAAQYGWTLDAWSILINHYHFVARSPETVNALRDLIRDFHSAVGRELNRMDGIPGRKVLYQFCDTALTFEKSYWVRLKYVHTNPVHHGVAATAENYRWCSASWFEREAPPSFVRRIFGLKIDRVNVVDDFGSE